jgi:hypothetical protein
VEGTPAGIPYGHVQVVLVVGSAHLLVRVWTWWALIGAKGHGRMGAKRRGRTKGADVWNRVRTLVVGTCDLAWTPCSNVWY